MGANREEEKRNKGTRTKRTTEAEAGRESDETYEEKYDTGVGLENRKAKRR